MISDYRKKNIVVPGHSFGFSREGRVREREKEREREKGAHLFPGVLL